MDGQEKNHDYEYSDYENSINPDSSYSGNDKTNSFPVQRMSRPPGSLFYQSHKKGSCHNKHSRAKSFKPKVAASHSKFQYLLSLPTSMLLLITLTLLLILLFFSSTYLVLRLEYIQQKVDFAIPLDPSNLEWLASWQSLLHTRSAKTVQEYLNTNLQQISKVVTKRLPKVLHARF